MHFGDKSPSGFKGGWKAAVEPLARGAVGEAPGAVAGDPCACRAVSRPAGEPTCPGS